MGDNRKILVATISPMPKTLFDPMPVVTAMLEGGDTVELFTYYPDEIQFSAAEFVGLTVDEARTLRYNKDVAYLKS